MEHNLTVSTKEDNTLAKATDSNSSSSDCWTKESRCWRNSHSRMS